MESTAARELKDRLGDDCASNYKALLSFDQIVRVDDDERATGARRFARGESAGQPAVGKFGVGRTVVGVLPVKGMGIK